MGYNVRRVWAALADGFAERMQVYGLRPADYPVLSLIAHNPGITSRQLAATLRVQPSNMVGIVDAFERRGLIAKHRQAMDRRALGLHATVAGRRLLRDAARTARQVEAEVASALSPEENQLLLALLQRVAPRDA